MSTYTQILYQIVFSTKHRQMVMSKENRDQLYKYIWVLLENKKCHPYVINGVKDHLHIVTHIHPSVALSDVVKDIKIASSQFIKEKKLFSNFVSWQEGYGAFTYSAKQKNVLIDYVKNQEEHHKKVSFHDEYLKLLKEQDVVFEEKYLL